MGRNKNRVVAKCGVVRDHKSIDRPQPPLNMYDERRTEGDVLEVLWEVRAVPSRECFIWGV